ncbi:hypothetical protein M0657_000876 [Pyricularia oryzae]|nr:hypothetical protein M9X92_000847 [Pyricularia oryzae]KAI7932151.1 hypothetical protein M0657_000876 [Pyricularia oryzae]
MDPLSIAAFDSWCPAHLSSPLSLYLLRVTEDICVKFATSSRRSSWCWTPLAARNPSNQVEDDEDEDDVDVMPVHSQLAKSIGPSLLSCQREPDHLEESLAPPRIVRNTPGSKSKKTFAEGWGQAETVRLLHSVTRDEMESVTALDRPAGPARLGGEPDGVRWSSLGSRLKAELQGCNQSATEIKKQQLTAQHSQLHIKMGHPVEEPPRKATREEMRDAMLPLAYRDNCANLLIPLNRCRKDTYYLPWKCENERHSYEKCQYDEFKLRVKKMDELREAKGGARSN